MIGRITRDQIRDRLAGRPHLHPVYSNVYSIPERLKQYDPNIFVVWNAKRLRYEVHSLANVGDTFGLAVPFDDLDARIEEFVWRNDARRRGIQKLMKEVDEKNAELERQNERQRSNDLNAMAREMRPHFRKAAWEGV